MTDETGQPTPKDIGLPKDQTSLMPNPFKERAKAFVQRISTRLKGPNPDTRGALTELAQSSPQPTVESSPTQVKVIEPEIVSPGIQNIGAPAEIVNTVTPDEQTPAAIITAPISSNLTASERPTASIERDVPEFINISDLSEEEVYNPGSMTIASEAESNEAIERLINNDFSDPVRMVSSEEVLDAIQTGKGYYAEIPIGSAADYIHERGTLSAEDGYLYHGTWDRPLRRYRQEGMEPKSTGGLEKGTWWSEPGNLAPSAHYRRLLRTHDRPDARHESHSAMIDKQVKPDELEIWSGKDWRPFTEYVRSDNSPSQPDQQSVSTTQR